MEKFKPISLLVQKFLVDQEDEQVYVDRCHAKQFDRLDVLILHLQQVLEEKLVLLLLCSHDVGGLHGKEEAAECEFL